MAATKHGHGVLEQIELDEQIADLELRRDWMKRIDPMVMVIDSVSMRLSLGPLATLRHAQLKAEFLHYYHPCGKAR